MMKDALLVIAAMLITYIVGSIGLLLQAELAPTDPYAPLTDVEATFGFLRGLVTLASGPTFVITVLRRAS